MLMPGATMYSWSYCSVLQYCVNNRAFNNFFSRLNESSLLTLEANCFLKTGMSQDVSIKALVPSYVFGKAVN